MLFIDQGNSAPPATSYPEEKGSVPETVFEENYDPEDIYRKDWEISKGDGEQVRVKGRLRENIQYWKDIGCN